MTKEQAIDKLYAWFMAEVGYIEKANGNLAYLWNKTANAGSANYTKYNYQMHQIQPSNMDYPAPWCDAFHDCGYVEVFGKDMAKKLLYDFDDYTVRSANLYKQHGRWFTKPEKGDQIFFKDSSGGICHTGWVYKVDSSKVYTIEGNTSGASGVVANGGCVALKSYSLSYNRIAGYGRPDFSILEEEIDMELLQQVKNTLDNLVKKVDGTNNKLVDLETKFTKQVGTTMIYNYVDKNMPEWAREAVQWEIDNGILAGDGDGLNLTYTDLRSIAREYRFFKKFQQTK